MLTASDVFRNMPGRFQADKAGDMNTTVQFDLSGEGGGQWYVTIDQGACMVTEGTTANPQATIRMAAPDYVDMTTGKLNPMTAFMSGKVKVEGDLATVMKFQTLFGM